MGTSSDAYEIKSRVCSLCIGDTHETLLEYILER